MQNTFNNDYGNFNFINNIEQQENSKVTLKEYGEAKQKLKELEKKKQKLENELDFIVEQNKEDFEKYIEAFNKEDEKEKEFINWNYIVMNKIKKESLNNSAGNIVHNFSKLGINLEKPLKTATKKRKSLERKFKSTLRKYIEKQDELDEIDKKYYAAMLYYQKIYDEKLEKENEEFSQED